MTKSHDDDRQRKVSERAYARWEAEGRPEGRHEQHWHDATREVEGTPAAATATDTPAAPVKRRRAPAKESAPAASPVEPAAKRPRQPRTPKAKKA